MKKTALTFGLFSLVVVATSFASPEVPTYLATNDSIKTLPIDGATGGIQKKRDQYASNVGMTKMSRTDSFSSVNQSFGNTKKID